MTAFKHFVIALTGNFIFLFIFNAAVAQTGTITVSGVISSNTTWSADTVIVEGNLEVYRDNTLTIESGTYVEFQGYYQFKVEGALQALGTESAPITFTVHDTSGWSNTSTSDGAWDGFLFNGNNNKDNSVLNYCIVEFGKALSSSNYYGGGILAYSYDELVISNCTIRNNYAEFGGGIQLSGSDAWIMNNKIYNNTCRDRGGAMGIADGAPRVINNVISNNSAGSGGGIWTQAAEPEFSNNLICNNDALGWGGGLYLGTGSFISVNNTICYNSANAGGGIFTQIQSKLDLYNDILWGNEASVGNQVYLREFNPKINFTNCNIQGNNENIGLEPGSVFLGEYLWNIDTVPAFVRPPGGAGNSYKGLEADFSLLSASACINSGTSSIPHGLLPDTDIDSKRRISYSYVDMGAYEYNLPYMDACGAITKNTTWTADTVKVHCDINIPDTYTLKINPGVLVQLQGQYKIEVKGTLLALGTKTDSIIFTVRDTTGFSDLSIPDGGWKGIEFNSDGTNDSSKILFTRIEYGKKVFGSGNEAGGGAIHAENCYKLLISNSIMRHNIAKYGGAIRCSNAPITITNSTINYNRSLDRAGGISCNTSDVKISGCNISNNISGDNGGGIYIYLSEPRIMNCTISFNTARRYGAGIYSYYNSRPFIKGNVISYNNCSEGGGGGISMSTPGTVSNNLICNNLASWAGGIDISTEKDITLLNNIICNNSSIYHSGAASISAGILKMSCNTIANNFAGSDIGGLRIISPGLTLENSIIWGNTATNDSYQIAPGNIDQVPDIFYSNIQGGIESVRYGSPGYPGIYTHNIDSLPRFVMPTESAGSGFNGLTADWSLLATSPSINSGNPLIDDPDILPWDYLGNPRLHAGIIDMGAIENQSGSPVLTRQALNYTKCAGESVEFLVEVPQDAFYQWQLNQKNIPGANDNTYRIDSIYPGLQGNYQCIIHNAYGTVMSNPALLQVNSPPKILSSPYLTWAEINTPTSLKVFAVGTNPEYQWMQNGIELKDKILNELSIPVTGPAHEGTYECIVTNICGADTSQPAELYLVPQICMVTVSTTTGHNLVIWEKEGKAHLLAYNIYRESQAAGIYDLMAIVPYDDLSIYTDTTADPTVQAYLYKITALDYDENETDIDLCKPHKTIHLIVSTNPEKNTTQLQWDRYYGFDYQTYTIYRSSTGTDFEPVYTLSASLNSWTDPAALKEDQYYRIAVNKPNACYPSGGGLKAGAGAYQQSMSNLEDNKLKAGQLPPETITLSRQSIPEENQPGIMIGKLLTEDADSIDSHFYQFVPGEGDDDNLSFTLLGDLLLASESFDFEIKNQYRLRIRSTDLAGNFCEVPFIIQIIDIDETTGLPNNHTGKVEVYPNPFNQSTTITFHNPEGEPYALFLMDLTGKLVRIQENICTEEFILKREGLGNGIYLMELKGNKTFRGKIVIR